MIAYELIKKLSNPAIARHKLKIYPYIWAKAFAETKNLSNSEIQELILNNIAKKEAEFKQFRALNKQTVLGALKLKAQSMFKKHLPKNFGRRMICLASSTELRKKYLNSYKEFCRKAYQAYKKLKIGVNAYFPLGGFRPTAPPLASALACAFF